MKVKIIIDSFLLHVTYIFTQHITGLSVQYNIVITDFQMVTLCVRFEEITRVFNMKATANFIFIYFLDIPSFLVFLYSILHYIIGVCVYLKFHIRIAEPEDMYKKNCQPNSNFIQSFCSKKINE